MRLSCSLQRFNLEAVLSDRESDAGLRPMQLRALLGIPQLIEELFALAGLRALMRRICSREIVLPRSSAA